MQASLFHIDTNNIQGGYALVSSLPVSVSTASGKIVVQANITDPNLSGVRANPSIGYNTFANVASSAEGDFPSLSAAFGLYTSYPQDRGPQFNFGASFADPSGDVCTSTSACASSAYPQIDLIGGTTHMDDWIFRDGFGP